MTAQAMVIIGATGDLAQRMLYPSLYFLEQESQLAAEFRIIGGARSDLTTDAFVARVEASVRDRADGYFDPEVWARFAKRLTYCVVDAEKPASFRNLGAILGGARQVIFY